MREPTPSRANTPRARFQYAVDKLNTSEARSRALAAVGNRLLRLDPQARLFPGGLPEIIAAVSQSEVLGKKQDYEALIPWLTVHLARAYEQGSVRDQAEVGWALLKIKQLGALAAAAKLDLGRETPASLLEKYADTLDTVPVKSEHTVWEGSGFHVDELKTLESIRQEGESMQNCLRYVGRPEEYDDPLEDEYWRNVARGYWRFFSLRKGDRPHGTFLFDVDSGSFRTILGRQDAPLAPKYRVVAAQFIDDFADRLGSETARLTGYEEINVVRKSRDPLAEAGEGRPNPALEGLRRPLERVGDRLYAYGPFYVECVPGAFRVLWGTEVLYKTASAESAATKLNELDQWYAQVYHDATTAWSRLPEGRHGVEALVSRFGSKEALGYALARLVAERKLTMGGKRLYLSPATAAARLRVWVPDFRGSGTYIGAVQVASEAPAGRANRSRSRYLAPRRNRPSEDAFPHSAFREFPRDIAEIVRRKFPRLWAKHGTGGNPPTAFTGDIAYELWGRWRAGDRSPEVREWAEERRERYMSRHRRDFRPGGIIAAIKWGGILDIGVEAMVETLLEEG